MIASDGGSLKLAEFPAVCIKGDGETIQRLCQVIVKSDNCQTELSRQAAIELLPRICDRGNSTAVEALISCLGSGGSTSKTIKIAALNTLGELGQKSDRYLLVSFSLLSLPTPFLHPLPSHPLYFLLSFFSPLQLIHVPGIAPLSLLPAQSIAAWPISLSHQPPIPFQATHRPNIDKPEVSRRPSALGSNTSIGKRLR